MLMLLCVGQIGTVAAPQAADPWYGRSPKPKDFEAPKIPFGGRFTIELPKNWPMIAGHGAIVFTVAEKAKDNQPAAAAIALERIQLRSSVSVTRALGDVELTNTQEREADGKDFAQEIKDVGGRRFIFIHYTRPGLTAGDSIVQYSVPVGAVMYRLICVAPTAQLSKYQPIFAHVAASFQPAASSGG